MRIITPILCQPNQVVHEYCPGWPLSILISQIQEQDPDSTSDILYGHISIHATADFNIWLDTDPQKDLFEYINTDVLRELSLSNMYLIVDFGMEGWSDLDALSRPIDKHPGIWNLLYQSILLHNIPAQRIIFVTSNLLAEQAVPQFAAQQGWDQCFRVFSFPLFEMALFCFYEQQELATVQALHIQHHTDKIFSSLSRINRPNRTWAQFQLSVSDIGALGLISHDKMYTHDPDKWLCYYGYPCDHHTVQQFTQWLDTLPLVVDQSDFSVNWALTPGYEHIHHSTCFQIVNETLTSDYSGSSMFYSEKTFRPIGCFQPFVIFGQPGANHYLKHLGYRLYDAWFDLSWDFIQDPVDRHRAMISAITPLVQWLAKSTPAARHQWRFQHADILQHNADVMHKSEYSKNKLSEFLTHLK